MSVKYQTNPIYYLFITLAATNILLLGLAIFKYAGVFNVLRDPLSYAGHTYTSDGAPNTISMYIYCADMILSSALMLVIAAKLKNIFSYKNVLTILALTSTLGFFIAGLSPDDTRHPLHVAGSAAFIVSLWLMATFLLYRYKEKLGNFKTYFLQIILQLSIFTYGFAYFLDMDISNVLQKFAVFALFISLAISSKYIKIITKEYNGKN